MDSAELEWIAWTNPITIAFGTEVAASDLSGRTVACHQHIVPDSICIVGPLLEAGARVRMAPCNPDSTDDRTAAHLASMGVEIRGHAGMSAAERADALAWLASEPADALCDMGGELIVATAALGYRPAGALEATTTGLHRLAGVDIAFPVLDWNGIALKDLIHNRHHVGAETWPAFTAITGLSLYGREIVVVGFGPVGQGVALRARDLGANAGRAGTPPPDGRGGVEGAGPSTSRTGASSPDASVPLCSIPRKRRSAGGQGNGRRTAAPVPPRPSTECSDSLPAAADPFESRWWASRTGGSTARKR